MLPGPAPTIARSGGMRRAVRALARTGLFIAITVVLAEGMLRAASLLAHGRQTPWHADAARTVLCVGDSHTYGALVSSDESYPGHLQRQLDEKAPGTWSVINLGIPGMNTSQVLDQLRSGLARYRPEIVIVWCGVNNSWNRSVAGRERRTWRSRLEDAALRFRLYRLFRVLASQRSLDRLVPEIVSAPGQRYEVLGERDVFDSKDAAPTVVVREGRAEQIGFIGGSVSDAQFEQEAADDYGAMVEASRATGARVVFVAYPMEKGAFQTANRALRRVAERSGAVVLESAEAVRRVPLEQRQLLWGAHPSGPMYAEIARDLIQIVVHGAAVSQRPAMSNRLLARMTFEAEEGRRAGACARATSECAGEASCYRWNPNGTVCNVERALEAPSAEVRAALQIRVASPPTQKRGTDIFGLFENDYGTGLRVEFADAEHLRVSSYGSAGATAVCGPLGARVAPNTWYTLRVVGKKGAMGAVALELVDDAAHTSETLSCSDLPLGGGGFTQVMVGSGNTFGAIADVIVSNVEVWDVAE